MLGWEREKTRWLILGPEQRGRNGGGKEVFQSHRQVATL
jgi:hypothetical protein